MTGLLALVPGTAPWRRKRLRAVMRGYRALRASSRLGVIGEIKNELTETVVPGVSGRFSPAFMGAAIVAAERVLRQYMLVLIGGVGLNRSLLMCAGDPRRRVVYPMPVYWQEAVRRNGFAVSKWRCQLLWRGYVLGMWAYGAFRALRILVAGMRAGRAPRPDGMNAVCFMYLSRANLPASDDDTSSHDIVSWFSRWPGRSQRISTVWHSVPGVPCNRVGGLALEFRPDAIAPLCGRKELLAYVRWSLRAILTAGADLLRGRWWHALLLSQATVAAQARCIPPESLARTYYFHNSGWIYRPFWTYEVEAAGGAAAMYFYSTNCEPFKRVDAYPPMYYGYRSMNWSSYLVWDEAQADFVRRAIGPSANIDVVGPIWFQGSAQVLEPAPGFSVAVFDVTPVRASFYQALALDTEFYVPETVNAFIRDVSEELAALGGRVVWKRKRQIGRMAHPGYRACAERLGCDEHVSLVDPAVSALRVIESTTATISLPFTSTALLACDSGKPSVFYDPSGRVQTDDRAAHGVPVLSGRDALRAWLADQHRAFEQRQAHA